MKEGLSDKDYIKTQNLILSLGKEIRFLRLDLFLERIRGAENLGSILDPTQYMAAQENLEIIKTMACGLMKFQESLPEISSIVDGMMSAQRYKDRDLLGTGEGK